MCDNFHGIPHPRPILTVQKWVIFLVANHFSFVYGLVTLAEITEERTKFIFDVFLAIQDKKIINYNFCRRCRIFGCFPPNGRHKVR